MAVRLILVALVLVSLSLAAAQQSEGTGGRTVDRRLNIRRFSARRKAEGAQKRKRPGATEEELARRKLLFERNRINRKRPAAAASATERATTSRPVTERRIQSSRTFRPRTRPDNFIRPNNEVEVPVVRISNNDQEIQDLVLKGRQEEKEDDRERTPFQGTSAVGTVSQPSGFRSSNEQIVRVSFKKPNEKPAKQDALEALLRTVNKKVETPSNSNVVDNTGLSVQQKAAVREMEQDDREAEALEQRKRLRAEENEVEGGRQRFRSFPSRSGSRPNPPRRRPQGGESSGARRDRVRTRGRGQTRLRTTAAPVTTTEAAFAQPEDLTLPPGLSFPTAPTAAPQPAPEAPRSAFTLDQNFGQFTDKFFPATQPSVPARAPAPTQASAPRAPLPAPVPAQRFPQRIEPAQQTFQQPAAPAQQTFRPQQTFQPVQQQQQPVQQQSFQQFQPQPVQQPRPAQTFQQAAPVQQQQNFQPQQQQQQQPGSFPSLVQLRQLQNTQAQPAQQNFQPQPQQQTFQPQQRFQPQAAAPQQPTAGQSSVFGGNPFNLINSNNNFAQFDAQFGGSVPEAPGAAQLSSQIFSQQPQAATRQQPFTAFGSTAQQGVSVFGR